MRIAFRLDSETLAPLPEASGAEQAQWIDLFRPDPEEVAQVEALGLSIPTLADMEEIEISNRLYRHGHIEVLTVVLPGQDETGRRVYAPVAFLLTPDRMVSVRHHTPRPFETFAGHAASSSSGCATPMHLFLGLIEEIVARLADLLEGVGRGLDHASRKLFDSEGGRVDQLEDMLRAVGRLGEELANYRLSLLTLERALTAFSLARDGEALKEPVKARVRDIQSLMVHAEFLSGRIAHVTDVILGMVNLEQTTTGRIVSVVAMLFMPPTLVASVYGMNFAYLPGLHSPHGYLIATGLMLGSALGTYIYFRWKGWL